MILTGSIAPNHVAATNLGWPQQDVLMRRPLASIGRSLRAKESQQSREPRYDAEQDSGFVFWSLGIKRFVGKRDVLLHSFRLPRASKR
jgi:hypothetical protein